MNYIKIIDKDNIKIFILVSITFILTYKAPKMFSVVFFLTTYVFFYRSKNDYFWIAFFLILYFTPFGFFSESLKSSVHRLPAFTIVSGVSFSVNELFFGIATIKAIRKHKKYRYKIQGAFIILSIYLVILLLFALFVHKAPMKELINQLRYTLLFSAIYFLPRLLVTKHQLLKLLYLLYPLIFFIVLDAIYFFITKTYLYSLINPSNIIEISDLGINKSFDARYYAFGNQFQLILFAFIMSLSQLIKEKKNMYLSMISFSCYILIFSMALRSWFVIFSIVLYFYFIKTKNKLKSTFLVVTILLFGYLIISGNEEISYSVKSTWKRLESVFQIANSSSISNDMISHKLNNRLPQQIEFIKQNPIMGWGFTDKRADYDVGNFGLIVEVGFLGFILVVNLWIMYLKMLVKQTKDKEISQSTRNMFFMFIVFFIGLLISHFTTNQIFGLRNFPVVLSLIFFYSDFLVKDVENEIHKLKLKRCANGKRT